jgi:ABC-type multidrug transport system ATPase subunit
VGCAPLDPPLPPNVTVSAWLDEVLELDAALRGRTSTRAARVERVAEMALRVGLARRVGAPLRTLGLAERRALVLAQSALSDPEVLLVEAPLAGLDDASAAFVLHAFASVAERRATIVSASRPLPGTAEGALASLTTDAAVFAGGELVHAGPTTGLTSTGRIVRLTIVDGAEAFAARLEARGIRLRGGPTRFVAELPEDVGATDLLRDAAEASASVVEVAKLM